MASTGVRAAVAVVWIAAVAVACSGSEKPSARPSTTPPPYDFCVQPGDGTLITMTASDGQKIKGLLVGTGTAGVVLGHQGDKTLCSWLGFAKTLAGRGYMALAVDFRGYGGSTLGSGAQKQTFADLDIAAAVAELRTRGATRVVIIGASLGATGGVVAAADIQPPVQGVVQISGPTECCGMDAGAALPRLRVPILYVVTTEDSEVYDSIHKMYAGTKVKAKKIVVYEGLDHGTEILDGAHGDELKAEILAFLGKYAPAA